MKRHGNCSFKIGTWLAPGRHFLLASFRDDKVLAYHHEDMVGIPYDVAPSTYN